MSVPNRIYILYGVVFLVSLTLRLALAIVNPAANDDHMEVVQIILQTDHLPTKDDCWECFQPKLYHAILAGLFHTLSIDDQKEQILFANLGNSLAGAFTLVVIGSVLIKMRTSPLLSLLAFAFVALNPELIGINAQATNDSILILFSTLALFCFHNFLLRNGILSFSLTILFVVLTASTKSNGIITFIAVLSVLFLRITLDEARRKHLLVYTGIFLIVCSTLIALNPLNQYIQNYNQYGKPFLLNMQRYPLPNFVKPTFYRQPGIISIVDGFFTFKLNRLLLHPRIERCGDCPKMEQAEGDFAHRTSLWTQLYARAHSLNFANWPRAWATQNTNLFSLLRAIYLLALIPSGLIVLGLLKQLLNLLRAIWSSDLQVVNDLQFGIFPVVLCGYIIFVMLYSLFWRDFTVMKVVFAYPALLAFPLAFLAAIENRPYWVYFLLFGLSLPLFCLYTVDIVSLIIRLV